MGPKTYALIAAALIAAPTPALADAGDFLLVNGTEVALGQLTIRRAGTEGWRPLASSPSPGARSSVPFRDPDCAFDIQGNVDGSGAVTWAGVNLCEVKSVTLRRDATAGAWVDYDGD